MGNKGPIEDIWQDKRFDKKRRVDQNETRQDMSSFFANPNPNPNPNP